MKNAFICADLHFGHRGVVNYLRPDGTKQRPWYNTNTMDEALIENWNRNIGPKDTVFVLGDVAINRSALPTIARCNGEKILVKGNHDNFRLEEYSEFFKDIHACIRIEEFILTHIPIHTYEVTRWKGNLHGHLHEKRVMRPVYGPNNQWEGEEIDPRYLCLSMEQINYTPIAFDDAVARFNAQQIV